MANQQLADTETGLCLLYGVTYRTMFVLLIHKLCLWLQTKQNEIDLSFIYQLDLVQYW